MKLQGELSITKTISNRDNPRPVKIRLMDSLSHCGFEIRLSLEDFAQALFGLSGVPCEFEVPDDLSLIGKTREYKRVAVELPRTMPANRSAAGKKLIRKAIAAHEVDGWKGDDKDVENHHNLTYMTDRILASVGFVRYVETPKGESND